MLSQTTNVPQELHQYYKYLNHEVVGLFSKWMHFTELFAHSVERIATLNQTAPLFFLDCQNVFRDDFVLSICRLSDSSSTAREENLALARLFEELDQEIFYEIVANLRQQFERIQVESKPFRQWRNKRIAHADLPTILEYREDALPGFTRKQIDDILNLIARFLNTFLYHFDNTTVLYVEVSRPGAAERLVHHLENGLKWRDYERNQKLLIK